MKERWRLCRVDTLQPGDTIFFIGVVFRLAEVSNFGRTHLKGVGGDSSRLLSLNCDLPGSMRLPVKMPKQPPVMPVPPPLRFISHHGSENSSWWDRLQDWLYGR